MSSDDDAVSDLADKFLRIQTPTKSSNSSTVEPAVVDVAVSKIMSIINAASTSALATCMTKIKDDISHIKDMHFFPPDLLSALIEEDVKKLGEAIKISNFDNRGVYASNSSWLPKDRPRIFRYLCPRHGKACATKGARQVFLFVAGLFFLIYNVRLPLRYLCWNVRIRSYHLFTFVHRVLQRELTVHSDSLLEKR